MFRARLWSVMWSKRFPPQTGGFSHRPGAGGILHFRLAALYLWTWWKVKRSLGKWKVKICDAESKKSVSELWHSLSVHYFRKAHKLFLQAWKIYKKPLVYIPVIHTMISTWLLPVLSLMTTTCLSKFLNITYDGLKFERKCCNLTKDNPQLSTRING